jgi:hypothetical protein
MKKILSAVVTVWCMTLTLPAFAAHPLATDDSGTQGKLKFQLETTAEFGWDKEISNNITTKSDYQTLNVAVTAGVLDTLDLVLSYPYTWQHSEDNTGTLFDNSGLQDLSLALKWRFLELGPASFALKPAVTFPTANRDRYLGAGRLAYGATLISTVEFKPVAVHANIGYTNQRYTDADKDGSREHLWNLSLAGSVEVMKGLQLAAELGTFTNPDKTSTTWPTFITGGAIYTVIENMDLSLGVKGSLTAPETDVALLTGVTFKFP